jgi:antitoxin component HigA of HigAB toxin-antitoxin module
MRAAPIEHPIRAKKEYLRFVEEIDALLDANPRAGSAAYDRLELLALLVEAYEDEHEQWSNDPPSPQSIVRFMAEQQGVTGKTQNKMNSRTLRCYPLPAVRPALFAKADRTIRLRFGQRRLQFAIQPCPLV